MQTAFASRAQQAAPDDRRTAGHDAPARRSERGLRPSSLPLEARSDAVRRGVAAPWAPLDPGVRRELEHGFGADLGGVRIHAGAAAARSARELGAAAYAVGGDVVFGAGRYAPERQEGRRLLAHELAHVLQQTPAGPSQQLRTPVPPPSRKPTRRRAASPPACAQVGRTSAPASRWPDRTRAGSRSRSTSPIPTAAGSPSSPAPARSSSSGGGCRCPAACGSRTRAEPAAARPSCSTSTRGSSSAASSAGST